MTDEPIALPLPAAPPGATLNPIADLMLDDVTNWSRFAHHVDTAVAVGYWRCAESLAHLAVSGGPVPRGTGRSYLWTPGRVEQLDGDRHHTANPAALPPELGPEHFRELYILVSMYLNGYASSNLDTVNAACRRMAVLVDTADRGGIGAGRVIQTAMLQCLCLVVYAVGALDLVPTEGTTP